MRKRNGRRSVRNEFIEKHIPCPCGESSDAYCVRSDSSGFCFSCSKSFPPKQFKGEESIVKSKRTIPDDADIETDIIGFRSISKKTAQLYDVETKFINGEPAFRGFPFSDSVKVKDVDDKTNQYINGSHSQSGLFGQDVFDPGSKECIIITEGEEDAMAAYEMLYPKFAAISIKSGSQSAYTSLVNSYEYVNSFPKIYICFDNDQKGREAVESIQGLFDFKKVYLVKQTKFKDANDYLDAGEADDFKRTVLSSKRYAPKNILSSLEEFSAALNQSSGEVIAEYPFDRLQDMTGGMKESEVIIVKAMEGVGKSEFFRSVQHHILETTDHPIGIIHLEEPNQRTLKALAGYQLGINAVRPHSSVSNDEVLSAIGKYEGRIFIHKPYDVDDEESFFATIRYLVSAMGCKVIFWDHISWVATSTLEDEDERKKLDRMSRKAVTIAQELKFCFPIISHVNDDGKTRGSRSITKDADTVISLYRDVENNSPIVDLVLDKNRIGGESGRVQSLFFDHESGMLLSERPEVEIE